MVYDSILWLLSSMDLALKVWSLCSLGLDAYVGDCQNYGPFLGPYSNTGPNTGPNLGHKKGP